MDATVLPLFVSCLVGCIPLVPNLMPIVMDQGNGFPVHPAILRKQFIPYFRSTCRVAVNWKQPVMVGARCRHSRFKVEDHVCMAFTKLGRLPCRAKINVNFGKFDGKFCDAFSEPKGSQGRFCADDQGSLLSGSQERIAGIIQSLKSA